MLAGPALASSTNDQRERHLSLHYYDYQEPGLMSVKSVLPTLSIGYRDHSSIRSRGLAGLGPSFDFEGFFGHTRYRGSGTHTHNYYGVRGEVYVSLFGGLYAGLGYRWLFDDFGPGRTSTNAASYDRLSEYLYLPIGVLLPVEPSRSIRLQVNYLIEGRQRSDLRQVPGFLTSATNRQRSGYGIDLTLSTGFKSLELYLRHWEIENSDLVAVETVQGQRLVFEPKNRTSEIGLRMGF